MTTMLRKNENFHEMIWWISILIFPVTIFRQFSFLFALFSYALGAPCRISSAWHTNQAQKKISDVARQQWRENDEWDHVNEMKWVRNLPHDFPWSFTIELWWASNDNNDDDEKLMLVLILIRAFCLFEFSLCQRQCCCVFLCVFSFHLIFILLCLHPQRMAHYEWGWIIPHSQ